MRLPCAVPVATSGLPFLILVQLLVLLLWPNGSAVVGAAKSFRVPHRVIPYVPEVYNASAVMVCRSKHVSWTIDTLKGLRGCTTVAGNVVITFLDETKADGTFGSSVMDYTFPNLIEITGQLVINRLSGFPSLTHMFPNLRIIRGEQLIYNFALVVYENFDLVDIAFPSLTTISGGYVIMRNNPKLCFTGSIDWDKIADKEPNNDDPYGHNIIETALPAICQRNQSCANCTDGNCWNTGQCQQYETGLNVHGNMTCHEKCIGGCVNNTVAGCFRCIGLHHGGVCVDECPPHTFRNEHIYGCGDADSCYKYNTIPMNGVCHRQCPPGTNHMQGSWRSPIDFQSCFPCPDGRCLRVCQPFRIMWLSELWRYRDCQVLNGSLRIQIDVHEHHNVHGKLAYFLRSVEQILGTFEVLESSAIADLSFMPRLRLIDPLPSELIEGKYAVVLRGNGAMSTLWNWGQQPMINVTRGGVRVVDNPRLCRTHLAEMTAHLWIEGRLNATLDEVEVSSNGDDGMCVSRDFDVEVLSAGSDRAVLRWRPFVPAQRGVKVVGYQLHYKVATTPTVMHNEGMDVCSFSEWILETLEMDDIHDIDWLSMEIKDLFQQQLYAFYVHAKVAYDDETTSQDLEQGLSTVRYFNTTVHLPLPPFVYTVAKTARSISIRWLHPGWDLNRYVETYVIDVYRIPDNRTRLAERDYCRMPKIQLPPRSTPYAAVQEPLYDCCHSPHSAASNFLTAHYGLDGDPDACGPDDHRCRRESEYHVLLANDTWYKISDTRLAAIRAEEMPLLQLPLPDYDPEEYSYAKEQRNIESAPPAATAQNFVRTIRVSNRTEQRLTIDKLVPFERYAIRVYACTKATQCGNYYQHFERTLRAPDADVVSMRITNDEKPTQLEFAVTPPRKPNGGVVLAYEFERFAGAERQERQCITEKIMKWRHYRIVTRNLDENAELSFRVRAITLGSTGNWTVVLVPAASSTTWSWIMFQVLKYTAFTILAALFLALFTYAAFFPYFDCATLRNRGGARRNSGILMELQPLNTTSSRRGSDCTIMTVLPADEDEVPESVLRQRRLSEAVNPNVELTKELREKMLKAEQVVRKAHAPDIRVSVDPRYQVMRKMAARVFPPEYMDCPGTQMLNGYFDVYGSYDVQDMDDLHNRLDREEAIVRITNELAAPLVDDVVVPKPKKNENKPRRDQFRVVMCMEDDKLLQDIVLFRPIEKDDHQLRHVEHQLLDVTVNEAACKAEQTLPANPEAVPANPEAVPQNPQPAAPQNQQSSEPPTPQQPRSEPQDPSAQPEHPQPVPQSSRPSPPNPQPAPRKPPNAGDDIELDIL